MVDSAQARQGNTNSQGRRNAADNPGNAYPKFPTQWERHADTARRHPLEGAWTRAHSGVGATLSGIMATTDGPVGWALLPDSDPRYDADRPFVVTLDGRPARLAPIASPAQAETQAERLHRACMTSPGGFSAARRRFAT